MLSPADSLWVVGFNPNTIFWLRFSNIFLVLLRLVIFMLRMHYKAHGDPAKCKGILEHINMPFKTC